VAGGITPRGSFFAAVFFGLDLTFALGLAGTLATSFFFAGRDLLLAFALGVTFAFFGVSSPFWTSRWLRKTLFFAAFFAGSACFWPSPRRHFRVLAGFFAVLDFAVAFCEALFFFLCHGVGSGRPKPASHPGLIAFTRMPRP